MSVNADTEKDIPSASIGESGEKQKSAEVEIAENHRVIHDAVITLRDTVINHLEGQGIDLDPSGWRVYAYDSDEVGREQAMNIDPRADIADPKFEIVFTPIVEWRRKSRTYFPGGKPTEENDGIVERQEERAKFVTSDGQTLDLRLLPIAARDPEWSEMECDLIGQFSAIDMRWAFVISSLKNGEVIVDNLRRSDVDEALGMAEVRTVNVAKLAKKMQGGRYHFRIFSNLDRRHSEQPPTFILANEKVGQSNAPQIAESSGK